MLWWRTPDTLKRLRDCRHALAAQIWLTAFSANFAPRFFYPEMLKLTFNNWKTRTGVAFKSAGVA